MPKIRVNFFISGANVELENITKELKIEPSNTRKKNDWPQGSINAGIAKDIWELQTEKEECKSISWQFDKLQNLLQPKTEIINKLCDYYELKTNITIVVEMEAGDGPEFVLSRGNVQFSALINAEIGFDLYID